SWTRHTDDVTASPIWRAVVDRTGRSFGFNYSISGTGEDFESQAGFVNRSNVINAGFMNRFTWYGATGALLERITTFLGPERIWRYDAGRAIEGSEFINTSFRLRGGWELSARMSRDFVRLDPADYDRLEDEALAPYVPLTDVSGLAWEISANTPTLRHFDADFSP